MLIPKGITLAAIALVRTVLGATPLKLDFEVHRGNSPDSLHKDNLPYVSKRESENGLELTLKNGIASYVTTIKVGSNQQEISVLISVTNAVSWVVSSDAVCIFEGDSLFKGPMDSYGFSAYYKKVKKDINFSTSDVSTGLLAFSTTSSNSTTPSTTTSYTSAFGVESLPVATSNTCTNHGSFETTGSSSFRYSGSKGSFEYLDVSGFWVNDSISIAGANISSAEFGIANVTSLNYGRLGLGLPYENTPTLPYLMKSQGIIDRVLYSLYLDSIEATSGSILFGAVDHAKYTGDLTSIPMLTDESSSSADPYVYVPVTHINVQFDSGSKTKKLTKRAYVGVFDPSDSMSYFPTLLYNKLLSMLGGTMYTDLDSVPCPLNDSSVVLEFDFNGSVLKVPLTSLIVTDSTGRYSQDAGVCSLAIAPTDYYSGITFGTNVMRHAYVVFDLEYNRIAIAQASFSDDEDVEIVSSSEDGIPGATMVSSVSVDFHTRQKEKTMDAVTYATGAFSGPDYVSTAAVTGKASLRAFAGVGGAPNLAKQSISNSIAAAILVILSYIV